MTVRVTMIFFATIAGDLLFPWEFYSKLSPPPEF